MSKLPAGVHFVCIVSIDVRKPRSGGSDYIAVSLYSLTGSHVGHTFVDRLPLWSTNTTAARIANERLALYHKATGIEASSKQPDLLYFKPFAVKITADRKSDQLKVAKVDPAPTGFQVELKALCERLKQMGPMFAPDAEGDHAASESPQDDADELVIYTVANVSAASLHWLWPQRFALGKVSIVAGDPGLGKSQLTAFLAAKVTTGGDWPNHEGNAPQGDVVMLSCEDDLADTIRPRLEAAGADLSRVHVISAVATGSGKRRSFSLASDVAKLEDVLRQLEGKARLVVIDPITAYMGGKIDNNGATEVRDVLNPVQDLAARYGVAIVCVSHPPKNAGLGKAVNAIIGSQAYVAATRAAWMVVRDEDNEDRRLFLQVKNNLGNAKGLAFSVQVRSVPTGHAPYIMFEHGYVETSADEALGGSTPKQGLGRSQMDRAKAFLQFQLSNGDVEQHVLMQRAELHSLTERTLQRAAEPLGIIKRKEGFGPGARSVWGYARPGDALFRHDA